jgi:hypothetical protein
LAANARYLTSVCTGSLLLGAAGLLRGRRAACHWAFRELLPLFGAIPETARVVRDGNIFSGGGVTAGIDMALTVVAEIAGRAFAEAVQLAIEYAPEPPFVGGRPELRRHRWCRCVSASMPCGPSAMRPQSAGAAWRGPRALKRVAPHGGVCYARTPEVARRRWLSPSSCCNTARFSRIVREVGRLKHAVATQQAENDGLAERKNSSPPRCASADLDGRVRGARAQRPGADRP